MGSSFPKCNQAGIESILNTDESLKEHVLFLSDQFPVALFTQNYTQAASDSIPLHWHDEMQLIWVFEGELAYFINGDSFKLDSSQILFISGRQFHGSKLVSHDAKALCINFTSEVFHPLIMEHCLRPILEQAHISYTIFPLNPYQSLRLENLLNWEPNTYGYFFIMNFISQVIETLLKDFEEVSNRSTHEETELFQTLLIYIHEHYAEPLTIKELSSYALLNKNKLTLLFKKYTHMSPIKYLNEYRLYMAKKLILHTEEPISVISAEVGYHQVSHFIEQFRARHGMSPLKFRNKYQKVNEGEK